MDAKIAEQILDELAPTFEAIESQSAAILQFLKDKNIANDEQLAPYMEKAAAASSVRWRALRMRMGRLFSLAEKSEEETLAKKEAEEKKKDSITPGAKWASQQAPEPWNKGLVKTTDAGPSEKDQADRSRREESQPAKEDGREPARAEDGRKHADLSSQKANDPTDQKNGQPSPEYKDKNAA